MWVACEFDAFADGMVTTTDEGISVTAETARQHGTDLLIAPHDANLTVTGFNAYVPTLDDMFLAITGEELNTDKSEVDARVRPTPIKSGRHCPGDRQYEVNY
jgi:ABC-2 type transport system ATP-binding protein